MSLKSDTVNIRKEYVKMKQQQPDITTVKQKQPNITTVKQQQPNITTVVHTPRDNYCSSREDEEQKDVSKSRDGTIMKILKHAFHLHSDKSVVLSQRTEF